MASFEIPILTLQEYQLNIITGLVTKAAVNLIGDDRICVSGLLRYTNGKPILQKKGLYRRPHGCHTRIHAVILTKTGTLREDMGPDQNLQYH